MSPDPGATSRPSSVNTFVCAPVVNFAVFGSAPGALIEPAKPTPSLEPNESEEKTASGLVIPDTAKEKPQQGEVLAAGPGRRAEQTGEIIPLDVKVGDTVVYSKYGGTEITIAGEDLLILTSRDVLAIRHGATTSRDDIDAALESLARYKRPRRYVFVPEVLRGPNGKADYRWAKEKAQEPRVDQ